jgi:hypothetical protein
MIDKMGFVGFAMERHVSIDLREDGRSNRTRAVITDEDLARKFEDEVLALCTSLDRYVGLDGVGIRITLTGGWKPRFWRNRDGEKKKTWEFIVSSWQLGEVVTDIAA